MILSDVLGATVVDADGLVLGRVVDARFVIDGAPSVPLAQARLVGLLVSPSRRGSFLGYERQEDDRPWVLARLLRWWHRGGFLVHWEDVARLDDQRVVLRAGYRAFSPALVSSSH